jgi:hypothetical protein
MHTTCVDTGRVWNVRTFLCRAVCDTQRRYETHIGGGMYGISCRVKWVECEQGWTVQGGTRGQCGPMCGVAHKGLSLAVSNHATPASISFTDRHHNHDDRVHTRAKDTVGAGIVVISYPMAELLLCGSGSSS